MSGVTCCFLYGLAAPSLMEALTTSRVVPLQLPCRKLSSSLSADFSCLEFKRYPCTSGRVSIMNHPNLLLRSVSASLQPPELSALGPEGNVAPSKGNLLFITLESHCCVLGLGELLGGMDEIEYLNI